MLIKQAKTSDASKPDAIDALILVHKDTCYEIELLWKVKCIRWSTVPAPLFRIVDLKSAVEVPNFNDLNVSVGEDGRPGSEFNGHHLCLR